MGMRTIMQVECAYRCKRARVASAMWASPSGAGDEPPTRHQCCTAAVWRLTGCASSLLRGRHRRRKSRLRDGLWLWQLMDHVPLCLQGGPPCQLTGHASSMQQGELPRWWQRLLIGHVPRALVNIHDSTVKSHKGERPHLCRA